MELPDREDQEGPQVSGTGWCACEGVRDEMRVGGCEGVRGEDVSGCARVYGVRM